MTPPTNQDPDAVFQLIDQTAEFLVIHKFPGTGFHRDENDAGLFETVKSQLALEELYPVHRLDKVTSGLLLLAKTAAAARQFGELFAAHQVEKYYLALARGKPRKKQGTLKGDMEKARRGAWKLTRTLNQPAITHFRSFGTDSGTRVFLVKPASGKTHQIRVALKSLGTPILGDSLYGGPAADRVYLHAFALRFSLNGRHYEYNAPPRHGELFLQPELATLITQQLTPPWRVEFPVKK